VIADIGSIRELMLLNDFNGRIGTDINNKIMGPYGEKQVHDNSIRLINTCKYMYPDDM